jgi:hypothetical protein
VPTNAVYAARLLSRDLGEETEVLLADLYRSPSSNEMLRRDIIYAMAVRGAHYWLSDLLKRYPQLSEWERRALLAASYSLGDEGKYWRRNRHRSVSLGEGEFEQWLGKMNNGRVWTIPL